MARARWCAAPEPRVASSSSGGLTAQRAEFGMVLGREASHPPLPPFAFAPNQKEGARVEGQEGKQQEQEQGQQRRRCRRARSPRERRARRPRRTPSTKPASRPSRPRTTHRCVCLRVRVGFACARRFLFLRSVLVERPSAVDGCGNVTVRIATDDGCVGVEQVWRKGSETYSTVLYSSLVQYK